MVDSGARTIRWNGALHLSAPSATARTGSFTGWPQDELDNMRESDDVFIDAHSAAKGDTGLVDLDCSQGPAISLTVEGQNLHDEPTQLRADACVGHDNQELRITIIQWAR